MDRKNYIDIENIREKDIDLGNGSVRLGNAAGFVPGDLITITEKFDGSNGSAGWDGEKVCVFSRRMELNYNSTLNGFFNYVQSLNENIFRENPDYIIFGEWATKNKIRYNQESMGKWYIFDIYNRKECKWLSPDDVKAFCAKYGLEPVHELYVGPFISWDHCRTFMHSPAYGDRQEGVVVRNVSKYNMEENRLPFILKIVNDDFKESMIKEPKVVDPEKEAAKKQAYELGVQIATENRIMKCLHKLQEDQIIPTELTITDMGLIAKNLPKSVFEDCLKEEKEVVAAMGEYAGKTINGIVMRITREKIAGD